MTVVTIILIIALCFFAYWIYKKFRKPKKDCIICYSGCPGSGKTLNMVNDARRRIRLSAKTSRKEKRKDLKVPVVYSNFPIRYKYKGKWYNSTKLTFEMMILREPMVHNNITIIDEFGSWIDQFSYNIPNIDKLDEHIRLWRHYHGNGSSLLVADQCTNNIVLQLRRRFGKTINCIDTQFYFNGLYHITKYRNVTISDELKTIEEINVDNADTDDNTMRFIGIHIPNFIKWLCRKINKNAFPKLYDDRCYSNRYAKLYDMKDYSTDILKTTDLLKWDKEHIYPNNLDVALGTASDEVIEIKKKGDFRK